MTIRIEIDYTNHRGERRKRTIKPIRISYGANKYHPKQQWLLRAYDFEKKAHREFAMKDIHSWREYEQASEDETQKGS